MLIHFCALSTPTDFQVRVHGKFQVIYFEKMVSVSKNFQQNLNAVYTYAS